MVIPTTKVLTCMVLLVSLVVTATTVVIIPVWVSMATFGPRQSTIIMMRGP